MRLDRKGSRSFGRKTFGLSGLALIAMVMLGCHATLCHTTDDDCGNDRCCKVRHDANTMGGLADAVTHLEDSIQRVGTVTVKQPDIFGETNLMRYIQEYEQVMLAQLGQFRETVQGYIARSDTAVLNSQTALGMALAKDTKVPGTASDAPPFNMNTNAIQLGTATGNTSLTPSDVLTKSLAAVKPTTTGGAPALSIEPTEMLRQQSTYIHTNQYLRRINTGDDNSQSAGYGMYLVRMPVSIQPGNATREGHSAVVTFRAQIQMEEDHLTSHFSRLSINDLTDEMANLLYDHIEEGDSFANRIKPSNLSVEQSALKGTSLQRAMKSNDRPSISKPPTTAKEMVELFSAEGILELRKLVKNELGINTGLSTNNKPQPDAVRKTINNILQRTYSVLHARGLDSGEVYSSVLHRLGEFYSRNDQPCINQVRCCWQAKVNEKQSECAIPSEIAIKNDNDTKLLRNIGWMLVLQNAMLEQRVRDYVKTQSPAAAHLDFANATPSQEAKDAWRSFIHQQYPLYVFALDPVVEEQNVYDAFSRRRELQIAVAYALANGKMNFQQANKFTRQLALDVTTIALNRTQVGFAHGSDTFGWRFYPRVQTPPEERSNIAAIARTLWSTGPTREFDLRHRMIEPGMRECEVLMVMPNFVPSLKLDVTTNWEKLNRPGTSRLEYDDMIELGKKLECVRKQSSLVVNQQCYRAGDYERLVSRIDQLEKMLPLQTYTVNVPYQYDLSGDQIFDKGTATLQPVVTAVYGLEVVNRGGANEAHFFVTGRNFDATRTHVIVGGAEAHAIPETPLVKASGVEALSLPQPAVEVISRELLKVKIKVPDGFTCEKEVPIRIATPAGVSNEHKIGAKCGATTAKPSADAGYMLDPNGSTLKLNFSLVKDEASKDPCAYKLGSYYGTGPIRIQWKSPLGLVDTRNLAQVVIQLKVDDKPSNITLKTIAPNTNGVFELNKEDLELLTNHLAEKLLVPNKQLSLSKPFQATLKLPVKVTPAANAGATAQEVLVDGLLEVQIQQCPNCQK